MESIIENTALQTRSQSIIAVTHRAVIISSLNWATWWQWSSIQRPGGTKMCHRQWRLWPWVQDTTIRPCQLAILHRIDLIQFKHYPYESIQRNQQPENLQWTKWLCPWKQQYWVRKAMSLDDSWVSTSTTIFLPIEQSAHTWTAFYCELYLWMHYSSKACLLR